METTVTVKKIYVDGKKWLKEMPDVIYNLKKNYNFEYVRSGFGYICISNFKDIEEFVLRNRSRNSHKICLYKSSSNRFYLVVYSKKNPTVYICDEYSPWANWERIKRFVSKFNAAYKKAEKELTEVNSVVNDDEINKDVLCERRHIR